MKVVSDLHLHSKYSQAVSKFMTLPVMAEVAHQKGIQLLGTGDFTHPLWLKELKNSLEEAQEGLYKLKNKFVIPAKAGIHSSPSSGWTGSPIKSGMTSDSNDIRFLLSVEISCIYSQNGKGRRVHNLVLAPSFASAEQINATLIRRGCNLEADGRPIVGLSSKKLLEMILEIDPRCMLIPCHVWTPWFGVYGARSGFNSLDECFGDMSKYVYAIETGISSDPAMNWQIEELANRSIVSFSDAHSPAKMGRESTVFELERLSYENIRQAIMLGSSSKNAVVYTIEFYPEEGKYHYSGHRNCHVVLTPEEQQKAHSICPVCGKPVTDGVLRRVQELAEKKYEIRQVMDERGVNWITDPLKKYPPFVKLVPLLEIVAESVGTRVESKKAQVLFQLLCEKLGSELDILLQVPLIDIQRIGGEKIADGIQRVRAGKISILPGFDGVYGKVTIWQENEQSTSQLGLTL